MAKKPTYESTFKVGAFVCKLTYAGGHELHCEWSPRVPAKLTPGEMDQYRKGRDALLVKFGKATRGGDIFVFEG